MPKRAEATAELTEAWHLLMGLVLEQRWLWSETATQLGVSQAALRALLAIDPQQPQPMRELARAMNCDPSWVTSMVDDLERAGYASRLSFPGDRRVKAIGLTEAGRDALRLIRHSLLSPPPELARLPRASQRMLAELLRDGLANPDTGTVTPSTSTTGT